MDLNDPNLDLSDPAVQAAMTAELKHHRLVLDSLSEDVTHIISGDRVFIESNVVVGPLTLQGVARTTTALAHQGTDDGLIAATQAMTLLDTAQAFEQHARELLDAATTDAMEAQFGDLLGPVDDGGA